MNLAELQEQEKKLLANLSTAYSECKSYFIDAEELLEEMNFFAAPLIEHRDALDHIMRYFSYKQSDALEAAVNELHEALEHEIRAFFDIADFICVTIRSNISTSLKSLSPKQVVSIWEDYVTLKEKISIQSEEIAKIRKSRIGAMEHIQKYKSVLKEMFDTYRDFKVRIEPQIRKRFAWKP